MKANFNKHTRYITRGIATEMPLALQVFLWQCIDDCKAEGLSLDYLQVFKFERATKNLYTIIHTQEKPKRMLVYYPTFEIGVQDVVDKIVFVIDDGDHSTMLFAEEY